MVAIVDETEDLDFEKLSTGINKSLPAYARPLFLRVVKTPVSLTGKLIFLSVIDDSYYNCTTTNFTGTFKLKKNDLQNDGYDLTKVASDNLYFNEGSKFVPLSQELYEKIVNGTKRL